MLRIMLKIVVFRGYRAYQNYFNRGYEAYQTRFNKADIKLSAFILRRYYYGMENC